MSGDYRILEEGDLRDAGGAQSDFARDVLGGLSGKPKKLSCRYIYDDRGSELFRQIMDLEQYYPSTCEREILKLHGGRIAEIMAGEAFNLVELGAGDGRKTSVLLELFTDQKLDFHYVPIDISEGAVSGLVDRLKADQPDLQVDGVVADYFAGLRWLSMMGDRRNLVLFLGGNIGNFDPPADHEFLHNLWNSLADGDLLLSGFDLKKDIDRLIDAYNDRDGVTAEFNLNLLHRINKELGGNFDVSAFRFFATWDPIAGAIQSFLISLTEQTVLIEALEKEFEFRAWEPIHTESSYKYLLRDIEQLAMATGFEVVDHLLDSRQWFTDSVWRMLKPPVGTA